MLVVRGNMRILSTKKLAPLCIEVKCELDGIKYKRIVFGKSYLPDSVDWINNGEYVSDGLSQILEKIYSEQNKDNVEDLLYR